MPVFYTHRSRNQAAKLCRRCIMKRYRQYILFPAVFAALAFVLYLLMVFSAAIPNTAIRKNMHSSAKLYMDTDRYAFAEDGFLKNVTDNHADQMWLNIGWNMGSGDPFRAALDTQYYDGEKFGTSAGLYLTVVKGQEANTDYTRYWHGTAGVLRILHLFANIRGIKTLSFLSLLLLIGNTLRILIHRGHWDLGLCVLASLFWVQAWNLRLSIEYLPCFLICFGLCPAFLGLERQGDLFLMLLSVVSGTLTAFFDFLTTETVTLLIPLIRVIAIRNRERRLSTPLSVMKLLVCCGLCWLLAYAGMFVLKWLLVSLATGENHFLSALDSAGQRVSGVVTVGQLRRKPGFLMAIAANFSALFSGSSRSEYRLVAGTLFCLILLAVLLYRFCHFRQKPRPGTAFILLLGSLVLLRYGFLANHSYLHAFFTYRALASTILSLLVAIALNLHTAKPGGHHGTWN